MVHRRWFNGSAVAAVRLLLLAPAALAPAGAAVYRPSSLLSGYGKETLKKLGQELDAALQDIVHVATR